MMIEYNIFAKQNFDLQGNNGSKEQCKHLRGSSQETTRKEQEADGG